MYVNACIYIYKVYICISIIDIRNIRYLLPKSFSKLTPTAQPGPLETLRASPRFQDVCQDDSPSHCDSTPAVALLACRFGKDHG